MEKITRTETVEVATVEVTDAYLIDVVVRGPLDGLEARMLARMVGEAAEEVLQIMSTDERARVIHGFDVTGLRSEVSGG